MAIAVPNRVKLPIGTAIVRGIEARRTAWLIDDSIADGTEKSSIAGVLNISVIGGPLGSRNSGFDLRPWDCRVESRNRE